MKVGELVRALEMMKTHVQRVTPQTSLQTALEMLDLYQTPALPVVDEANRPIGIVTEGDIARAFLKSGVAAEELTVASVQTCPVECVRSEEPLQTAAPRLLSRGYKRTPVLNPDGVLIGALDRVDLLLWLLESSEAVL